MRQLELRFYPLDEIAQEVGRERNQHFAEAVKNDLTNWGYEYQWLKRRGVVITKRPETAEECLAELAYRHFKLSIQIEAYAFAHFLFLLLTDAFFGAMPWAERAEELDYQFGISTTDRTLRSWASYLFRAGFLHKDEINSVYWKTYDDGGKMRREPVEPEENEIKNEYFARRNELVRQNTEAGMEKSVAWKCAYKQLWGEYGCCYYPCSHLVLNALQEDIDEMLEWVTEICVLDEED